MTHYGSINEKLFVLMIFITKWYNGDALYNDIIVCPIIVDMIPLLCVYLLAILIIIHNWWLLGIIDDKCVRGKSSMVMMTIISIIWRIIGW